MIIDNTGFDVAAMLKLTKKEFIEIHLSNDAIGGSGKTDAQRKQWLEKAWTTLKQQQPGNEEAD